MYIGSCPGLVSEKKSEGDIGEQSSESPNVPSSSQVQPCPLYLQLNQLCSQTFLLLYPKLFIQFPFLLLSSVTLVDFVIGCFPILLSSSQINPRPQSQLTSMCLCTENFECQERNIGVSMIFAILSVSLLLTCITTWEMHCNDEISSSPVSLFQNGALERLPVNSIWRTTQISLTNYGLRLNMNRRSIQPLLVTSYLPI